MTLNSGTHFLGLTYGLKNMDQKKASLGAAALVVVARFHGVGAARFHVVGAGAEVLLVATATAAV